jgi:site-specific DNA-methyltransferase (adenine-specific)
MEDKTVFQQIDWTNLQNSKLFINGDCVEYMKTMPDKYVDLALIDPPYGIERFSRAAGKTRFKCSKLMQESGLTWDKKPNKEYWSELFRVSKNQIIWGANNFNLPTSEYFLIWDKQQTVDNFATAEYAWVSMGLKKPAKIFRYSIHKHNADKGKIHPTQKPVALYKWLLAHYAKPGDKILDTHVGSASSLIACYDMGFDYIGFEIDKDYYDMATERIRIHMQQQTIFDVRR